VRFAHVEMESNWIELILRYRNKRRKELHVLRNLNTGKPCIEGISYIYSTDRAGIESAEMNFKTYEYACTADIIFNFGINLRFAHSLTQKPVNVTNYHVWQQAEKRISTCPVAVECFNTVMSTETPMAFL